MNTHHIGMLGLTVLGLVLAVPAQANPHGLDESFMLAQRDSRNSARQDPRAENKDTRNSNRREANRDEPAGYGYGYERRQQQDQVDGKGREPRPPRR
ncbi:MAG: hypothetical protein Q8K57_05760 [Thiobacillus sp.]|nr:hypothetical protein [Gammaproteobacteria bacterium]MDP1924275.1 hypothetical protein [Thiobacillus sp.]